MKTAAEMLAHEPFLAEYLQSRSLLESVSTELPWYARNHVGRAVVAPGTFFIVLKRTMDLTLSLAAMVFVLPALFGCAIAIRLDSPGPVFFRQRRTGKGGHRFAVYKLRTMVVNAEEMKQQLLHLNELKLPDFKITNDPRVTRVGRILRKFSLDELPQFLNVLKGDMSLVGPRPSSYSADRYNLWHTERFEAKPGITGLAQILGRSELYLDEKLRYDIAYLRNCSILLDIRILLRTVKVVLKCVGVK